METFPILYFDVIVSKSFTIFFIIMVMVVIIIIIDIERIEDVIK